MTISAVLCLYIILSVWNNNYEMSDEPWSSIEFAVTESSNYYELHWVVQWMLTAWHFLSYLQKLYCLAQLVFFCFFNCKQSFLLNNILQSPSSWCFQHSSPQEVKDLQCTITTYTVEWRKITWWHVVITSCADSLRSWHRRVCVSCVCRIEEIFVNKSNKIMWIVNSSKMK